MGEKMIVTKFIRDEAQIKQDWLCLLMNDENAPLDVSYRARLIRIDKEYYPIAVFSVTCEAEWQATSYWEHVEEYQVAREETVYIDYRGEEHKDSGRDFDVRNGHTYYHYRKPMSRTVYDTKKRTVTDSIQQTSGFTGPTRFSERVWTGEGQSLANWIDHFDNLQFMEVDQNYFKDYKLIPERINAASAKSKAEKMGRNDISAAASHDVPGDRYENLTVSARILDISRRSFFLGVYHIFYEYEGKEYNCLMSGGKSINDVILGDHPIDNSIKERQEKIQSDIKNNSFLSGKTLFLLGSIIFSIWTLVTIVNFVNSVSFIFATGQSAGTAAISFIWLLIIGCGDAFCIYKYRLMKRRKCKAESEKKILNEGNANIKQKIYDIIQNDSISEDEKKRTIKLWLQENEAKWKEFDDLKANTQDDVLQQKIEKLKRKLKK
ncbi:MAG: hypothetical protein IJ072_08670 [Oscillospiraceae bacterium]|nr:hypothetical protein [Oscillospiraceae bacterium]